MSEETPNTNVRVSAKEYLALQSLFKAASIDQLRPVMTKVFYWHERSSFVATDGQVLRVLPIEWGERVKPESDGILDRHQVYMPVKVRFSCEQPDIFLSAKNALGQDFGLSLRPATGNLVYPNIKPIIDKIKAASVPCVAMGGKVLSRFLSSFPAGSWSHKFEFSEGLQGIRAYSKDKGQESFWFSGVIMPQRIVKEFQY